MSRRVRAEGQASVQARYHITGGCDTDKNIIVAAIFEADTGHLESREFQQPKADALLAAEWFRSRQVELVIIESTANYHLLYYDILRAQGINILVINPIVVKSLLRVEGKSDKGDAMTLARLASSFALKTSNMPDQPQRELRLLFKRIDAWKVACTQTTNRANSILTGCGFTVFRLVSINSPGGLKMFQAILDRKTPVEIAALYRSRVKRPEIEKSAAVELPEYVRPYLQDVLADVRLLNQKVNTGEIELFSKIETFELAEQVQWMCTVPGVTKMLCLRVIAEMGANYQQRYPTAEAFAKAIGVVPANEVSGGKLLKRKASHGNMRVKFHLLSAAKSYAIHGSGPLKDWYEAYRAYSTYFKATSALARRMAEGLWWVMTQQAAYKPWEQKSISNQNPTVKVGSQIVDSHTGEVLEDRPEDEQLV